MKKILWLFLYLLPAVVFGQGTIQITGLITEINTGIPIANHPVYAYADSTCANYSTTIYTDPNGNFFISNYPTQCVIYVYVYDCMNTAYTATITPNTPPAFINFAINTCAGGGGGCSANFTATTNATNTVSFSNLSTASGTGQVAYVWDFGNGTNSSIMNPSVTYSAAGTYIVCLTMNEYSPNGAIICTDTFCNSVVVSGSGGNNCQASFGSQANGNIVYFNNASTPNANNATYSWNFGNSGTSNQMNPIYTYPNPGVYNVCLTMTVPGANGTVACTSVYCDSVVVSGSGGNNCQASFGSQANGNIVYFSNASTPNANNATYSWNFGNSGTSNQMNPIYTYPNPGVYNVCLTMTVPGANGTVACTSVYCDSVVVSGSGGNNCQASFGSQANGNIVYFNNASTPNANNATYSWNFGNSGTSNQMNPIYTYPNPGVYNVCLTMTVPGANGTVACTSVYCDSVVVSGSGGNNCQASFGSQANGNIVYFNNASTPNANNATYSWNFGNSGTSNQMNPIYTYPNPGVYNVCLTMTVPGVNGTVACTSVYCDSVVVSGSGGNNSNCVADFTYAPIQGTTMFQFTSTSTGNIISYSWTFPGGSPATSTQQNPQIAFNSLQPVNVSLTIVCIDSLGNQVTVTSSKLISLTDVSEGTISAISDIYPNPSNAAAYLDMTLTENSLVTIRVVNIMGQQLTENVIRYPSGNHQVVIKTEMLASGFYFVEIKTEEGKVLTKKFVKE